LNICGDEHVSPWIVKIIQESCLSNQHTLFTVDDFRARGVDDQIWVRTFSGRGGNAIIGADAAMTRRPHEVVAICEAGVRLILLPPQWANAKRHLQASHLLYWWPHIEVSLEDAASERCLRVPWGWPETAGAAALKPVRLDLQDAYRKIERAAKRAAH
jgi:hypothetical protein